MMVAQSMRQLRQLAGRLPVRGYIAFIPMLGVYLIYSLILTPDRLGLVAEWACGTCKRVRPAYGVRSG